MDNLDIRKAVDYLFNFLSEGEKAMVVGIIADRRDIIENCWLENPDLRFTQVLICTGIIPNFPGMWYYREEEDIIKNQAK